MQQITSFCNLNGLENELGSQPLLAALWNVRAGRGRCAPIPEGGSDQLSGLLFEVVLPLFGDFHLDESTQIGAIVDTNSLFGKGQARIQKSGGVVSEDWIAYTAKIFSRKLVDLCLRLPLASTFENLREKEGHHSMDDEDPNHNYYKNQQEIHGH
eukprot:GAFH01002918.1.p2 GENE.GAFH01002918.1~~GAFH01002918.1.p2  ORF type:complete len:155 (+),score=1.90 GAFH01002918.1:469-933(+)